MSETNEIAVKENEFGIDLNANWEERLKLVKEITAKNCSQTEFELLVYTSKLYELNPLKKEIWAVKYAQNPALIFVGRDGFLSIAHRSGQFDGMKTTINEDANHNPLSATCIVYRKDMAHPVEATVYLTEFNKSANPLWASKPRVMLQKVAESFALRRAFNVSGVYSPEEIDMEKEVIVNGNQKISPKMQSIVDNIGVKVE